MKTVYLDTDFICHLDNVEGRIPYETEMFDDKCEAYVEGYRIVPEGYTWIRPDGQEFHGEMIAPAANYVGISSRQTQWEEDNENMLPLEDVADLIEMVYEDDLEVIG